MPLHSDADAVRLGSLQSGPAWSTIKVPLAVAALRRDPHATADVTAAITRSDNAAAQRLWRRLGSDRQAAARVRAILREGGDTTTVVPDHKRRREFSIFGQTTWTLTRQARFAGHLDCVHGSGPVRERMGRVANDQRWGLGRVRGARFKGGWGPDTHGRYLVRQFGVITTKDGRKLAVAIAVRADSGSFAGGVKAINLTTDWVRAHAVGAGTGQCRR